MGNYTLVYIIASNSGESKTFLLNIAIYDRFARFSTDVVIFA